MYIAFLSEDTAVLSASFMFSPAFAPLVVLRFFAAETFSSTGSTFSKSSSLTVDFRFATLGMVRRDKKKCWETR